MKKVTVFLLFSIALSFVSINADAQVLDGIYVKEHHPARKVVPYTHLREADVFWMKRIWRRIDLKQKTNQVFYYPETPAQGRMNLFDVIKNALLNEGTLTAYNPGTVIPDDEFKEPFTLEEVQNIFVRQDTQQVMNLQGEYETTIVPVELKSVDIKAYEIKEEWFFDKQRSVMEARVIGLCPLKDKFSSSGEYVGVQNLFWIYFPEARYVFINAEVYNRFNDAARLTYDDIFHKRMFSSYITKESNVYDRTISMYKTGIDALLEAEAIKEKVFNTEHDLWSF